jgi:cytoskeleton protein RodZ
MIDDLPMNDSMDAAQNQAAEAAHSDTAQAQVQEQPQISAGEQLRTLREARGWSTAQVANQLNLATRQIEALEQDNYAALPGMVIVRGFVRSYAKILQADATPILAAINGGVVEVDVLPPARSEMSASFTETQILSDHQPRRGSFLKLLSALIVLLILAMLALLLAQRMHWLPQKLALSPAKIESELTRVTLDKPASIASQHAASDAAAAAKTATEKSQQAAKHAEKNAAKAAEKTAKPADSAVSASAAPVAEAGRMTADVDKTAKKVSDKAVDKTAASSADSAKSAPAAPVASGKNALVIAAHEDSWLEIKQADDTVIVSRILPAGSSEVFNINQPVAMVIGNAAGVAVSFRGKPLDVTSGTSSNVARLNLK